jgi:hypothetical protein
MIFNIKNEFTLWGRIHNTTFSLKLTHGPNKLQHSITKGRKGLPVTDTLAYWAHS